VELLNDNLFTWRIQLFGFDEQTQIFQDLLLYTAETDRDHIMLEAQFPSDYPTSPPFIRVVYPRFHQYTGHITDGGSICVHELTTSGWRSDFQLHQFIVFIRNLLLEGYA